MLIDERTEFADATALSTSGTGRANVGDVVDLGAASSDLGHGTPVYLVIRISTAVDSSTDGASVSFILCSDAGETIAADGSATDHIITPAIAEATLVAGYTLKIPLPNGDYERYLGIQQNVSGEAVTAGAFDAFLTDNPPKHAVYPDAVN